MRKSTTRTFGRNQALKFEVRCDEDTCGDPKLAMLAIESARATVEDTSAPVIAPTTPSVWQRTPAVTVSATDASGVASLTLKSGDKTLGTMALACDYRHLQPCPGNGSATFTAELPDGTYPLTAQATDAAGQSSTAPYGTLMLDRTAPASPTGLIVRATGNGMYAYTLDEPGPGAGGADRRRAPVGRHRREGREPPAARVGVARRARPSRGRGRERRPGDGGRRRQPARHSS